MNGNSVPLWAFLLTALAAVIGPFITTWAANRNARVLLQEQHANERAMYLLDKKREAYDQLLKAFANIVRLMGVTAPYADLRSGFYDIQMSVQRLDIHAPPYVIDRAAEAMRSVGNVINTEDPLSDVTQTESGMLAAEATRTIRALGAAIRADMEGATQPRKM